LRGEGEERGRGLEAFASKDRSTQMGGREAKIIPLRPQGGPIGVFLLLVAAFAV